MYRHYHYMLIGYARLFAEIFQDASTFGKSERVPKNQNLQN